MTAKARPNNTKHETLSIPEVLKRVQIEKLTAVVPVKLWPSLANYVKMHGGSTLLRQALLQYLDQSIEEHATQ